MPLSLESLVGGKSAAGTGGLSNPDNLGNLAQLIQTVGQANQRLPVETARVGNANVLVDNSKGPQPNQMQGLAQLVQQQQMMQARQKRSEFLKSVQTIMESVSDNETKIMSLMQLEAQHGTDYGLGLKDIEAQYNKNADREVKKEMSKSGGTALDKFLGEISSGAFEDKGALIPINNEQEARGRAERKYGPDYAKKYPQIEEQISKRFGKDSFGFTPQEKRTFKGKPFIYIGNDQWLPEKEFKKRQNKI